MTVYGVGLYGGFTYGLPSSTDITVYPFTARSLDYGAITLSWVFPKSTGVFTDFCVVRNVSAFPVNPDNGDLIYKTTYSALDSANPKLFETVALVTDLGNYYLPDTGAVIPSYTSTVVYSVVSENKIVITGTSSNIKVGQLVTGASGIIGGTVVKEKDTSFGSITTLTLSNPVTVDSNTTLTFSSISLKPGKTYYYSAFIKTSGSWIKVGNAMGTSIKNFGTADTLYDYLPPIYTAGSIGTSSAEINKNSDLYNVLRTVAVQYDLIKTKVENAKNRYDVLNLDGKLIPALMDEFGFSYESALGVDQGRRILKYANFIYLNKGTVKGLKQFISAFTGYSASIQPVKNLFLTLDCASFEVGMGFWRSSFGAITATQTTTELEGGSPPPIAESASPSGYPNSTKGFLKVTATDANTSSEITYGTSLDDITVSTTTSNSSDPGYNYITLTTDTKHGLSVGQQVVIRGMQPKEINGIWQVVAVPTAKTFTFYTTGINSLQTIAPANGNTYGYVNLYDPINCGIPVTSGSTYTFSLYAWAKQYTHNIDMGVRWYDIRGNYISENKNSSSLSAGNSQWDRLSVSMAAPTYAKYAVPFVRPLNFGIVPSAYIDYFDAFQFELANSATTYADARRVDIYLDANRINEVKNPGFESSVATNWTITGGTRALETTEVYPTSAVGLGIANSVKSAKITIGAGGTTTLSSDTVIPVTETSVYTLSAYSKLAASNTLALQITWKDASNSTIGSPVLSTASNSGTSFARYYLTAVAPKTATKANVAFIFTGTSGDLDYIDSVMFEKNDFAAPYFDGGTGYYNVNDIFWEQNAAGTAGTNSTGRSLYYPNLFLTKPRLDNVLKDYLPIGTSWAVFVARTAT